MLEISRFPTVSMDGQELLRSNLGLVERLVRFVCRRAEVAEGDVDDFASTVKLALIENDYAILRGWEGRSALATYLTVIIQRLLADERIRDIGRWRPSAEAKRLGDAGILLELLVRRDQRPVAEAIPMVRAIDDTLTAADIEAMLGRLPQRAPRARLVEVKDDAREVAAPDRSDRSVDEAELRSATERANRVLRDVIAALPVRDRMLLRLRFVSAMPISEIARILQLEQRPLYRRLEQVLGRLREALETAGIDAESAAELVDSAVAALDFGLAGAEIPADPPDQQMEGPEQRGGLS